ncbi:MAG: hypothetical protein AB7L90_05245 [Hyphomicrobiaceae bacterium]
MPALLLTLVARVPPEGVADFRAYEEAVLPLLCKYGGALERRLRNADGTVEIHVVRFAARPDFERFRADPDRLAAAPLLKRSEAVIELMELHDVD